MNNSVQWSRTPKARAWRRARRIRIVRVLSSFVGAGCFLAVLMPLLRNPVVLPHSSDKLDIPPSVRMIGKGMGACPTRLNTAGVAADWEPALARRRLYQSMNESLSSGLKLAGNGYLQGAKVDDFFKWEDGILRPVLRHLKVPVRAIVMPIVDPDAALALRESVVRHVAPLFSPGALWMQDSDLLHSTMYHASSHLEPVPANASQVDAEVLAVINVADKACAVRAVLDSLVITPSGTVLALWQPAPGGTDPADLRSRLRSALPKASKAQVVNDQLLLHTTIARAAPPEGAKGKAPTREELWDAAAAVTGELCGLETWMEELWFVEEEDMLALALGGRLRRRTIPMQCQGP